MSTEHTYDWRGVPRPDINNPEVKRRAALKVLPEVLEWYGCDVRTEDGEKEEILKQLTKVVGLDGYEAASDLDREGWYPDAGLVNILEGVNIHSARDECVREWLEQNGVTPKLKVGDRVNLANAANRLGISRNERAKILASPEPVVGEVIGIRDGRYTLNVPALGHVRPDGIGVTGIVLDFEEVEKLEVVS